MVDLEKQKIALDGTGSNAAADSGGALHAAMVCQGSG
jgi:hypothetical protein